MDTRLAISGMVLAAIAASAVTVLVLPRTESSLEMKAPGLTSEVRSLREALAGLDALISKGVNQHDYAVAVANAAAKLRLAESDLSRDQNKVAALTIERASLVETIWRVTFDCYAPTFCPSMLFDPMQQLGLVANKQAYFEWAKDRKLNDETSDRDELISQALHQVHLAADSALDKLR